MNDPDLNDLLTQHRRHLEHQRRELYEHNVDEPCPCTVCERDRFEHRTVLLLLLGLAIITGIWALVST